MITAAPCSASLAGRILMLRRALVAGALILSGGCASARAMEDARLTCVTDSECEAAWGMTLEEAMTFPEGPR